MLLEVGSDMDEVQRMRGTESPTRQKRRPSMKRMMIIGASLMVLLLIGSAAVMGGQMPVGAQSGQQEQPSGQQPMMGGMMGMMCPMMGGMRGQMDPSGMMAMMSGGQRDPKAMARMLEFRGDLLKAMGEVMLRHAKSIAEGK
jgi:hypothetical protein